MKKTSKVVLAFLLICLLLIVGTTQESTAEFCDSSKPNVVCPSTP